MHARTLTMRLWVEPDVVDSIATLPGHLRQRVRRAVSELAQIPRPPHSRALSIPDDLHIEGVEARRLRIDHWRVVYIVDQDLDLITVLAVRRRPPYNYDDLRELLDGR
jgi:mRNA-degrading endonuclease RelE of RelBE toxin-antitoxin system